MSSHDGPPVRRLSQCPVCASTSLAFLPVPGHWIGEHVFAGCRSQLGLCRCQGCSLVFTNPRPSQALLDQFYSGQDYACHEAKTSAIAVQAACSLLDYFQTQGPPLRGRRLLDFGCGGGFVLIQARAAGWEVMGYDVGQRALATCRRQGLTATDRVEELPRGFFDAVLLNHVLEHIDDHSAVLRLLKELLNANGKLLIVVPNLESLRARLSFPFLSRRFAFDERYRAFPIHLSFFSRRTLRHLLEKNGFRILATRTTGVGLDELFARRDASCLPASLAQERPRAARSPKWALKNLVKDLLFGLHLGEHLQVLGASHATDRR